MLRTLSRNRAKLLNYVLAVVLKDICLVILCMEYRSVGVRRFGVREA